MFRKHQVGSGKKIALLLAVLTLTLVLNGCASSADTLMSPGPTLNSTQMPGNELKEDVQDMLPGMSPDTNVNSGPDMPVNSQGVPDTLEKVRQLSDEMEEAVDRLTEVDDVAIVAIGDQVLVAIEFEPQYQGELDDRIRSMILSRVQQISKGVNRLYITADPAAYEQIDRLTDQLENASSISDITARFAELTGKIPEYKK